MSQFTCNRRKNMKAIGSKDTSYEIKLRKAMWNQGIRYRKNWIPCKNRISLLQNTRSLCSATVILGMAMIGKTAGIK
jgi:G:T-mismatch repair DNA endonuclease (very short patch repair protein)